MQLEAPTTLNVKVGRIILRDEDILLSRILFLEGRNRQEWGESSKKCAPCHLPIDRTLHPKLGVAPKVLFCIVCGKINHYIR